MGNDVLKRLVNPAFEIEWEGKQYQVRKANLGQVIQYRERLDRYVAEKTSGAEQKLVAFCLWLILKDQVEGLTEEDVLNKTNGGVNTLAILTELGFLPPEQETAIPETASQPTTEGSS